MTLIGEGHVNVGLHDRGLTAGLKAAKAKVKKTMSEIDGMRAEADIRADSSQLDRELAKAHAKLEEWEHERATATLDVDKSRADNAIAATTRNIRMLTRQKHKITVEMDERSKLVNGFLGRLAARLRGVRIGADDSTGPFNRLGKAMHNARITMGPLSLSLRGLFVVMATLAPLIAGVVAAVGGLAAVAGGGILGSLGFAASGAAALLGPLGGIFAVLKAHPNEVKQVTAQFSQLGEVFKKNSDIPKEFGQAMDQVFKFAKPLVKDFGKLATESLRSVSMGVGDVIKSFKSNDLRGVLFGKQGLFTLGRTALRPLTAGLGDLVQIGARISQEFARFLPGVATGFEDWADGALKSLKHSKTLKPVVKELMADAGALGKLLTTSGETMLKFIVAAGPAGRVMVKDLTDLVAKWGEWLSKPENMEKLQKWLKDGWETVKKFAGAVENLAKAFDKVRKAAKPFIDLILAGLGSGFGLDVLTGILGGTFLFGGLKVLGGIAKGMTRLATGTASVARSATRIPKNPFARWRQPKITPVKATVVASSTRAPQVFARTVKPAPVVAEITPKVNAGALSKVGKDIEQGAKSAGRKAGQSAGASLADDLARAAGRSPKVAAAGSSTAKTFLRGVSKGVPGALVLDAFLALASPEDVGDSFADQFAVGLKKTPKLRQAMQGLAPQMRTAVSRLMADLPNFSAAMAKKLLPTAAASNKAFGNVRQAIFNLARTTRGQRFLLDIQTKGGKEARQTLTQLAQTKIGRKVLEVISRGGPAGIKLMRELSRTKLGRKLLQVIERGGKPAANILKRLQGSPARMRKLVAILEKGGPAAQKRLQKLLGIKLPAYPAKVSNPGGKETEARLSRLKAITSLGNALKNITANDQATSVLQAVAAWGDLGTATKTIAIAFSGGGKAMGGIGFARGNMVTPQDAGVGSPVSPRAVAAASAHSPLGSGGGRVSTPRFLSDRRISVVGEEPGWSEYVIPMNPAYRGRAMQLWMMAARNLGISGFKKGKPPSKAQIRKRRETRHRLKDKAWFGKHKFKSMRNLTSGADQARGLAEGEERAYDHETRAYQVRAEDHQVLNEDGSVNKGAVNWHVGQIDALVERVNSIMYWWSQFIYQISLQSKYLERALRKLDDWNPLSSWGKGKRKDTMSKYNDAAGTLKEEHATAWWNVKDRGLDIEEWRQQQKGIKNTKADPSAAGPTLAEQTGVYNDARLDLFRTYGGNTAVSPGILGMVSGPPALGAFGSSGAGSSLSGSFGLGAFGSAGMFGAGSTGPASGPVQIGGQGGGDKTVQQNITIMQPPPDAHTFTKSMLWEAQHAL